MKSIARIVAGIGLLCLGFWILGNLASGHLFPRKMTERLTEPKAVSLIRGDGLFLESGRLVPLPWIRRVPKDLPILKDAVAQEVEIDAKGHVFGLVRIHHWCGNDPVRKHLARVDLSNMLIAWGAETTVPVPEWIFQRRANQRYTKYGWDISDYIGSAFITRLIEMEMKSEPSRAANAPSLHR